MILGESLRNWAKYQLYTLVGLLVIAIMAGIVLGGMEVVEYATTHYTDPIWGVTVNDDDKLDFNEAAAIALRMNELVRQIERTDWDPKASPARMHSWAMELLPMYNYEGMTDKTTMPMIVAPNAYLTGMAHNHIAGQSDCATKAVLNLRYTNPISAWYSKETWIVVLAHELAHVEQGSLICMVEPSEKIENTAQIVSWEIVAALANQGNKDAAFALVYELRGVALSAAKAAGTSEQYEALFYQVFGGDAVKIAAHEKGNRYWASRPEQLKEILEKYNRQPLEILHRYRKDGTVYELAVPNKEGTMVMDDFYYFMAHAETIIREFILR